MLQIAPTDLAKIPTVDLCSHATADVVRCNTYRTFDRW